MAMCKIGDKMVRKTTHGPWYGENRHNAPRSNFKKVIGGASREADKAKNGHKTLGLNQKADTLQGSNILKDMERKILVLRATILRPLRGGIGMDSPFILEPDFISHKVTWGYNRSNPN